MQRITISFDNAGTGADDDADNADWVKQSWSLANPDGSLVSNADELRAFLARHDMPVERFKRLPVYRFHVDRLDWLREI